MKNLTILLATVLTFCLTTLSASTVDATAAIEGNCNWKSWFKYPQNNKTYEAGKDVYVKVDAQKYQDIAYMELYIGNKLIRKESQYPYEWCKGSGSSDSYLRKMKPGTYKLKCKIKDKCGKYHEVYCTFYVKGDHNGGGHGKCEYKVWYKYPQNNKTYEAGKDVYVYFDAQNYKYIKEATLYINGKKVRTESSYPYEWCKGSGSSDGYLRKMSPGTYKLECKIKDVCGNYKSYYCTFYVKGGGDGGKGGNCKWTADYHFQDKKTFKAGQDVYVKVNAQNYKDIAYMQLYCNNRLIRKESQYPYEWCKGGGSSDGALRKCKKGTYRLKCVIVDKCGKKVEKYRTFYVK